MLNYQIILSNKERKTWLKLINLAIDAEEAGGCDETLILDYVKMLEKVENSINYEVKDAQNQ